MKYKVGDTIRIVKPEDIEYDKRYKDSATSMVNSWHERMDEHTGEAHIINFLTQGGWRMDNGLHFSWLEDWLELVETPTDKFDDAMKIL